MPFAKLNTGFLAILVYKRMALGVIRTVIFNDFVLVLINFELNYQNQKKIDLNRSKKL